MHARLEAMPFALALAQGRIEQPRYVDYLRALAIMLDTTSTQTQRHGSAAERAVFARFPEWCELLAADLAHLAPKPSAINAGAIDAALAFAEDVRRHVGDGSAYLLGVAYVIVGSHRGNRSIAAKVESALGLGEDEGTRHLGATDLGATYLGATYLGATRGEGNGPWQEFTALLERELSTAAAVAAAVDGARATFAIFEAIFAALERDDARPIDASAINPEAGHHPIPQELELVELAIAAADQANEDFPYLSFRYGTRGRRFTHSDSAWLLTLLDLDMLAAEGQVDWLAGMLASRGIPSLCLQGQLHRLAKALDELRGPGSGARLVALGHHVARHRSSGSGAPLPNQHERELAPVFGERGGALLRCAVADQRGGLGACADNIRAWAEAEARLDDATKAAIAESLDLDLDLDLDLTEDVGTP